MGTASEENQISERADETSTSTQTAPAGRVGALGHGIRRNPRRVGNLALPLQWHCRGNPRAHRPHLTTCASFPTRTIGKS